MLVVQNSKLVELIRKQKEDGILYVGAFLRKDAGTSQADPEKWKDTDKLPEVHDFGTLAQIHWALPGQENSIMLLYGHRWVLCSTLVVVWKEAVEGPIA